MRKILAGLMTLAVSASALVKADSADYLDLVGLADKASAQANWALADSALLAALRLEPANPTNILLMSNLGMVRYYQGLDSLALETLNQANAINPKMVAVLSNRARVLTSMGRSNEAMADYIAIAEIDSTLTEPHFYLSLLYLRKNDIESAEAETIRLRRLDPTGVNTQLVEAALARAKGDIQEAIIHYNALIRKDPQPEYYAERALCHLLIDDLGSATDDIALGLELDPTDPDLYTYRALLNKMRYRNDDAKTDAQKAIELGADPRRLRALLR